MNILNKKVRYLSSLLALAYLLTSFSFGGIKASAKDDDDETIDLSPYYSKVIVSLGDSYSSGEGIDNFYDFDLSLEDKVQSSDWLAHRSQNCWSGMLTLPGVSGTMSAHRNENWYFTAVSGAETTHINNSQPKDYSKSTGSIFTGDKKKYSGTTYLDPQIDIFSKLEKDGKTADYVTMTMGGNDAGFSDIISAVATRNQYINFGGLEKKLDTTWDNFYKSGGIRDNLKQVYKDIEKRAGADAQIIIAGYPKLLDECYFVASDEKEMVNSAVSKFNDEIEALVNECRDEGMKISFVSVEEAFDGHEAYSSDPYINEVMTLRDQDLKDWQIPPISSYSIHPNKKGAEAYAKCVQAKIDELEAEKLAEWEKVLKSQRKVVLVLDVSGSMYGDPIDETKKAAENFIDTALENDASIGIVTYNYEATEISNFSATPTRLKNLVSNIYADGGTNIDDGLTKARDMLDDSNAKNKIIVLMSDGQPNHGRTGQELIDYADELKEDGIYIYTLGFFDALGTSDKADAQELMGAIASEGCHYEVEDAEELVFFFGDIASQLSGEKYIYVRIACPVDVSVKYNGEELNSKKGSKNTRTDFGTLTFEEGDSEDPDDKIKILRLKDGVEYDIEIEGYDKGTMDYTIGFMDDNGEYSDMRTFSNIKIKEDTIINTVASSTGNSVLKVDQDGDGKYDLFYEAKANGKGKKIDYSYIYSLMIGTVVLIALLIVALVIVKKSNRKIKEQLSAVQK